MHEQGPPANPSVRRMPFSPLILPFRHGINTTKLTPMKARMNQRWLTQNLAHIAPRSYRGGAQGMSVGGVAPLLIQRSSHHKTSSTASSLVGSPSFSIISPAHHRRCYSQKKFSFESNSETSLLERIGSRRRDYQQGRSQSPAAAMSSNFYLEGTPDEVKNSKGLHLLTMNTPNGQGTTMNHRYRCIVRSY